MKKSTKFLSLACAGLLAFSSLAACGGGGGGSSSDLQFWVYGDEDELEIYSLMTNEFNRTYGKEHGISVEVSTKPVGSYQTLIQSTASSKSGPDIFFVEDDRFKTWASMGFMPTFTEEDFNIEGMSLSEVPAAGINRLRYDKETTTSTENSPIYGLPLDTKPTALYYNESLFEKAGITVISVDEENMEDWNKGLIADRRGKKKSDYAKIANIDVPSKGFYRSISPYTTDLGWTKPTSDEIMVFNNRIPMNWDEVEDLGMLFTPLYNPSAQTDFGTDFGFFTEWWFWYGWSVGGDCLADLTGQGEWTLSLLDPTLNYKVIADTYVGEHSGKTYKKGETLEFVDKLAIPKGVVPKWEEDGTYTIDGETVRERESVVAAAEAGTLMELPSQLEAFTRYLRLGVKKATPIEGIAGLELSPNPNMFGQRSAINYFYSSKLAMVVQSSAYIKTLSIEAEARGFEWDVAPLPVYKAYTDPEDPDCDEVKAIGLKAGHSNSKGMVTRTRSADKKAQIAAFMLWMSGLNGQRVRAANGRFPNQQELVSEIKFDEYAPRNVAAFGDALEFQTPGDWWYLRAFSWIDIWAVPLNGKLRNNVADYTYEQWKRESTIDTHKELEDNYITTR